jgi:hypothetical protein
MFEPGEKPVVFRGVEPGFRSLSRRPYFSEREMNPELTKSDGTCGGPGKTCLLLDQKNCVTAGIGKGLSHRSDLYCSWAGHNLALKAVGVVADGHGEGQQLFERLLWIVKLDGDPAGLQAEARG